MSQIAEQTGIGRVTLYRYFPDVEAILKAWHDKQIAEHLAMLADTRDRAEPRSASPPSWRPTRFSPIAPTVTWTRTWPPRSTAATRRPKPRRRSCAC